MQKELEYLFPTPIMTLDFEGEQLEKIQSQITNMMVSIRGSESKAPWGDNVGTTFDVRRNHDIESFALEGMALAVIEGVNAYLTDIEYSGPGLRLAESWFNFFQKGGFQFDHVHPGSRVSGVYYYQTTEGDGELRFSNPVGQLAMGVFPYDGQEPPVARVVPKVGRMVLFPSWLSHRVQPIVSDGERISISFNLI